MYIALCDDDKYVIDKLKNLIYEYGKSNRIGICIDCFSNGEELLKSKANYDFIILDYQMENINGLEVAKSIREKNTISAIVFLTGYPEFMIDAFEVNTFRFLLKPIDKDKLYDALDSYISISNSNYPILIVSDGERIKINSNDVYFIEADGKCCNIHLKDKIVHSSKTMSNILKLLPKYCFVKTHRSYAVNLHLIKNYSAKDVYLINNEFAYMSKTYYKPFRVAYMNFLDKYYVRF